MEVNIICSGRLSSVWVTDRRKALGLINAWPRKIDDYWFTECPEIPF